MDKDWLRKIFEEAGLDHEQAREAARVALLRLLRRQRPAQKDEDVPRRRALTAHLVKDPLVSLARIVGLGGEGLPFIDEESGKLSPAAFAHVLGEAGLDPVVSMAFARVVVEIYEPKDLYRPIWEGLGHQGDVDLDSLRRMDWTPLRREFPELGIPADMRPTEQIRVKPKAEPPGAKRLGKSIIKKS